MSGASGSVGESGAASSSDPWSSSSPAAKISARGTIVGAPSDSIRMPIASTGTASRLGKDRTVLSPPVALKVRVDPVPEGSESTSNSPSRLSVVIVQLSQPGVEVAQDRVALGDRHVIGGPLRRILGSIVKQGRVLVIEAALPARPAEHVGVAFVVIGQAVEDGRQDRRRRKSGKQERS